MNMYEELKAWADKWGVKYTVSEPTEQWPYYVIAFDCCDYQEPTFHYNPKDGWNFWHGGE